MAQGHIVTANNEAMATSVFKWQCSLVLPNSSSASEEQQPYDDHEHEGRTGHPHQGGNEYLAL
jgi:hypothetical protein